MRVRIRKLLMTIKKIKQRSRETDFDTGSLSLTAMRNNPQETLVKQTGSAQLEGKPAAPSSGG